MKKSLILIPLLLLSPPIKKSYAQSINPYVFPKQGAYIDWRAFENGEPVVSTGGELLPEQYDYLEGHNWFTINENVKLQTLTVARSREGHPSQHIIAKRSTDGGKTWSDWFDIEPEGPPMSTYGSFIRHPVSGKIVYMYLKGPEEDLHFEKKATDHLDIATFLGWWKREPFRCYPHLIGNVVFRYVNENGQFSEAKKLDLPLCEIDRDNIFEGKYSVMYNVPSPKIYVGNDAVSWFSKHGPIPRTGNGGAFIIRYKDYLLKESVENAEIIYFPDRKYGIRHPEYGCAGGFSPLLIEDNFWLFRYRTIHGFIGTAASRDKGENWDIDILRYDPGGYPIKNPMGPFGITKDPAGNRYFVWYNHSHSGFDEYVGRDLVYITFLNIVDQELHFGQPELFHYRKDQLGYGNHTHERLNTPSITAGGEGLNGRSSDKESIRSFRIPQEFLDALNKQSSIKEVPETGLVFHSEKLSTKFQGGELPEPGKNGGFTLSFSLALEEGRPGQIIMDYWNKKGFRISVGEQENVMFRMSDGKNEVELSSDAYSVSPGDTHYISIIVDGYPDLITMIVDERFQDGGKEKYRGTCWFDHVFSDLNAGQPWQIGVDLTGTVSNLYVHDRFLLATEAIGLHRVMSERNQLKDRP